MLAIMPKHKGTDHLKADLRSKISRLQREGLRKKQTKRTQNPYLVDKEGAAQIMLLGPPNSGKSQVLKTLSPSSQAAVEPYPYSTQTPVPGMMQYQNVAFQLIDLPPIINGKMEWWQAELLKLSDGGILVLDLADSGPLTDLEEIEQGLDNVNIKLVGTKEEELPIGVKGLPAIIAANKLDVSGTDETLEIFLEFLKGRFEVIGISAQTGKGLAELGDALFNRLQLIRIFTKIPGKDPDYNDPYVLTRGATVMDLATSVHKDFGESLNYACVWGENTFDGQRVSRDYQLSDGEVVELHL